MKKYFILNLLLIVFTIFIINPFNTFSQSVAITDDDSYIPDESAMLDVKSTDKGILVPRMLTIERVAISSPATGLMVYDTDLNNFFYYNGITWMGLPQVGVSGFGGPLFHVVNSYGDTIFAVYDDGVQIIVPTGVKGKVGGFAVSGRSPSKGVIDDYLVITPDSARIYINDTITTKGKVGGFAVSGRSPSKGTSNDIFFASVDSTRIYVEESTAKGKVGGFAVSGRSPAKATTSSFLNLSSKNYFIGHNSGVNNTTGDFNFFAGYNSGFTNTTGFNNIFLGYQSGYNNLGGVVEEGSFNTFIGYESGFKSEIGGSNTFLGFQSGYENFNGNHNTYLGRWAGKDNTNGSYNVFVGTEAGRKEFGSYRLCINAVNDFNYRVPLIYGEFDNRIVVIDGDASDNPNGHKFAVTGVAGAEAWVNLTKKTEVKGIIEITESLDKIVQLQGISYTTTDKNGANVSHIGINPEIAVNVIPEIAEDYGSMYGIDYNKLTVLLIEAFKEQQIQIDKLQKLIQVKDVELQKSNVTDDQINLLIEENKKLKEDITFIKDLLKSNLDKE